MKRLLTIIGLAGCLALAACGPPPKTGIDPVTAAEQVQRIEDRYLQAKAIAEILMPFLPAKTQERIRRAERIIEQALVIARVATGAERQAALDDIKAQVVVIETAAPLDPD